jgi:hypothetical protein
MSVVTWYKVEIIPAGLGGLGALGGLGLPLTVSNDVLAGSLVLDAEITVRMCEGAAADSFEVTLINLPDEATELIRAARRAGPLNVSIHLGYFDEPTTRIGDAGRVMLGRVMGVTADVGPDGYGRTTLIGQEEGGYKLRQAQAALGRPDETDALDFATALAGSAGVPVAQGSTLDRDLTDFTVRAGTMLSALQSLAGTTPLVVRDGTVYLGDAVGASTDPSPMVFDPDTNLISLAARSREDTQPQSSPPLRSTVDICVLGHPRLRVGQVARISGLSGVPTGDLRIASVLHQFKLMGGYTARISLIAAAAGEAAQVRRGVQVVIDRWSDVIDQAREDHPAIDVGEVTAYVSGADGKHAATLHYGQESDPTVDAPSLASPVDQTTDLVRKPVASPFAFDRTGLVVPVYPGMRALLAHNRGLVNDAVVAGFVWPDNPAMRRPPNQDRDYWLALPTGLDSDGRPTGPGANDLIDGTGHRVVQVAGLRVGVGPDLMDDVGTRPEPPADTSLTIAHHSGTTITIDENGAVTITTNDKPITLTNGGVSLTLSDTTVAVS